MADLHGVIIKQMTALGYKGIDNGICKGLAMMGIQAAIIGQLDTFNDRISFINNHRNSLLENIEEAKQAVKIHLPLTDKQKKVLEILSFFDGINLYLAPNLHTEFFSKYLIQANEEAIAQFTQSEQLETERGLVKIFSTCNVYTASSLTMYLQKIETCVHGNQKIAITLCSCGHAITIVPDIEQKSGKRGWQLIDANKLDELHHASLNSTEIAAFIIALFYSGVRDDMTKSLQDNGLAILTDIYTTNKCNIENNSQLNFAQLKNIPEHQITPEKLGKSAPLQAAFWLWSAAQNGHVNVVTELLTAGAKVDEKCNGSPPLWVAAQSGHVDVVTALFAAGADINKADDINGVSPFAISAYNGHTKMVQMLLIAGVTIQADDNGFTIIQAAVENGHENTVVLLLNVVRKLLNESKDSDSTKAILKDITCIRDIAAKAGHHRITSILNEAFNALTSTKAHTPLLFTTPQGDPSVTISPTQIPTNTPSSPTLKITAFFSKNPLAPLVAKGQFGVSQTGYP